MLVLSRKPEQHFCFPNLGVNIRVLSVKGRSVRIGIDAPKEFEILRGELRDQPPSLSKSFLDRASHEWRNQLNAIKLGLHLAQRHLQAGDFEEGQSELVNAIAELTCIERSTSGFVPSESTSSDPHVLLVEDDPNELRLLAGLLRMEGYRVTTAADGEEAIQRLDSGNDVPDFVLLDMRMPHRNGPETVRWIRSKRTIRSLPVYSVSATSPQELGLPVGPDGVNAWFPKPLDPVKLLTRLRNVKPSAV